MNKVWIPLAVLVVGGGIWLFRRSPDPVEAPFAKARRETLISTLPTNGKIEPLEWEAVRAEAAGIVDRVPVQEGQRVAKGAVLASLRSAGAPTDLAAAEARIARAEADLAAVDRGGSGAALAEIESGVERARFQKQTAQHDYDVLSRLEKQNAATRTDVEAARTRMRQAEIEIESLTRKRAALVGSTDRSVAAAQLREGQVAASAARNRMSQTEIRSPIAGVIYNLAARPGAYLNPGDLVANVGRLDKLRVRVYVDEPDLGRLAIGQPVAITWDALPGNRWTGMVDRMPTEIIALGTRQVGQVLCTIQNTDSRLVPGTNVNAEIRTGVVGNAVTIPKEAMRRQGIESGVLLLRGDRVEWKKIEVGAASATRSQILNGLVEGDAVALQTERPLKSGGLVKPVYHE